MALPDREGEIWDWHIRAAMLLFRLIQMHFLSSQWDDHVEYVFLCFIMSVNSSSNIIHKGEGERPKDIWACQSNEGWFCLHTFEKMYNELWLMWFSGLSAGLWTKVSLVRFPVRAHAWVAGRGQVGGMWEATTNWCFSPSISPSLSLKINKNL